MTDQPITTAITTQKLSPKAEIMRKINEDVPLTHLGLPEYMYRADLIPSNLYEDYDDAEQLDVLETAIIELDYSQGFPTLPTTDPFWGMLPGEPINAYNAFLAYVDLPRNKASRTNQSKSHPLHNSDTIVPVRQLHLLKDLLPQEQAHLLDYYHTYYWAARIRAYDLFHVAHHNKLKEQRLMGLEEDHYGTASKFLAYATNFLDRVFASPDEYELKPKEAMDLMLKMMQVQRVSVGASPMGSHQRDPNALPRNASMEVILRQIAQQAGNDLVIDQGKNTDPTKALLADPDSLLQAQELIIKMQGMAEGGPRKLGDFEVAEAPQNTNTEAVT